MNISISFSDLREAALPGRNMAVVSIDMENNQDFSQSVTFSRISSRVLVEADDYSPYSGEEVGEQLAGFVGEKLTFPAGKSIKFERGVILERSVILEIEFLVDGQPYGGSYALELGKGDLFFPVKRK